ncbi:MAG: hypothetical protein ACE5D7_07155, partial [Fidelibacterota bacterium]
MSVATSDNLDAIYLNPAGLGVDRGFQSGFHIMDTEDQDLVYHSALRAGGLGFSLYGNGDIHYRIGFGTELMKNTYFGYVWDNSKINRIGLISRPNRFVSFGYSYGWNNNDNPNDSRLGLAVRPLGYRLTIGADLIIPDMDAVTNIDEIEDYSDVAGFIEIQPVDGLYFSASSSGSEDFTLQVGLNFGTGAVYSSQSQQGPNSTTITEFGVLSHSQVQETLIRTKPEKPEIYYRMTLEDYMIEEKPFRSFSFNFNPFGSNIHGTQLRDWLLKMEEITNDESVAGLIVDLKYVSAGFGKLSEMRNALQNF